MMATKVFISWSGELSNKLAETGDKFKAPGDKFKAPGDKFKAPGAFFGTVRDKFKAPGAFFGTVRNSCSVENLFPLTFKSKFKTYLTNILTQQQSQREWVSVNSQLFRTQASFFQN